MPKRVSLVFLAGLLMSLAVPAPGARAQEQQGPILFPACQQAGTMTVHVFSDPRDASLQVNGTFIGQTPAKLCLPSGPHEIRVSRSGYTDGTWEFETLPGSEVLLQAELKQGPSEAEKETLYRKSSATVWALRGIENDKSCRQALDKYRADYGDIPPLVRDAIETTYRDIIGACDANDPRREDRNKARQYLMGLRVRW
ncbi:MAG: PEGA domain-containing protein [Terriglobia bacterium]